VRLIDEEGKQVGIVPIQEALQHAKVRDLDLVEVSPDAKPPVCKVMDFGKYKYQISKKQSHKKVHDLKEVKIRPRIDDHDLQRKVRKLREFLDAGHKAKVSMFFRGRERARPDLGLKVFERMIELIPGDFNIAQQPKQQGNSITMVITKK
jgi:translation initiation factor IF-3